MTTTLTIAVGHRCAKNSELAKKIPYEVAVFPVGEDSKDVIIGTHYKHCLLYNGINLTDIDKDEVMRHFESFKQRIISNTNKEDFNKSKEHKQWLQSFAEAKAEAFILITE